MRSLIAHTWQSFGTYRRISTWTYLIQTLVAVVFGVACYSFFERTIGDRPIAADALLHGWDYTTFMDLKRIHADGWNQLFDIGGLFIIGYMIVSVGVNGALLGSISTQNRTWRNFWRGGVRYMLPFTGYALFFIIALALLAALLFMPILSNMTYMMEYWPNEPLVFGLVVLVAVVFMLGCYFLFLMSVFTRLDYISHGTWWSSLVRGWSYTIRYYIRLLPYGVFIFILIVLLYSANLWLQSLIGISSIGLILLFFVVQQFIVWCKISLRTAVYASLHRELQ